jgi:polyisoprenoid-binding protein YceI
MSHSITAPVSLQQLSGTYTLDPEHTRIGFVARHAMVTKVRGSFVDFEGSAVVDGVDFTKSSVSVVIRTASIDTRNRERDEHLRSGDFLGVSDHPEIHFRSTAVRLISDTVFEVEGDLTIKGVTRSVTVEFTYAGMATDPWGATRIGFDGSAVINRRDFGVSFNAALETGGVLVSDKVALEFEISAVKAD